MENIKEGEQVPKIKYYAIKEARDIKDKIVNTWSECKEITDHCPAVYKSFKTKEEALDYLKNVNVEDIKEQTKYVYEKSKELKANTKAVQTRIPNKLYSEFIKKCEVMEQEPNIILKNMIKEWLS